MKHTPLTHKFGMLFSARSRYCAYRLLLGLIVVLLTGCGALGQATPQPLPTVVLDGGGTNAPAPATDTAGGNTAGIVAGSIIASGIVVPAEQVQLASASGGTVEMVSVEVGSSVKAGDVLVRLSGSEKLSAAVAAARLELLASEQALAELNESAGQARAQAQLRLALARDVLDTAEKRRGWKEYRVGDDNQIAVARADLIVAEDRLKNTEDTFGSFADNPEDNLNKAAALSALSAARQARDKALANLNYLLSLPDDMEVTKADAELEVARTELEAAQREYDRLQNGPAAEDLALAQARIENAQAQLAASQSALAELELKAPMDGAVSVLNIHSGEWVSPGQLILVLADLEHLRVQTTDLSERDVPNVQLGQPVTVTIKALNLEVTGRVQEIAPLADTLGGDVVYKTIIALDTRPPALRAGMSVDVQYHTEK